MFVSRPIRHPLFKNYTMVEAADALAGSEVGECLFRPSPRGTHQLCVSVKLHDGPAGPHFLHTDVKEDPRAKVSELSMRMPVAWALHLQCGGCKVVPAIIANGMHTNCRAAVAWVRT